MMHSDQFDEFMDLQNDDSVKPIHAAKGELMCMDSQVSQKYEKLATAAQLKLLPFPTTYLVECAFSAVTDILKRKRGRLEISVRGDLRLKLTYKVEMDIIDNETGGERDPLYNNHDQKAKKTVSVKVAFMFIVSEMIGAGTLALPYAIVTAGPFGLLFCAVIGPLSAYGGIKLARCWQIIIERWPKYDMHIKDPFPIIGEICYGKIAREFVRLNVFIILCGSNIVILLFASQLTEALFTAHSISYCYWVLLIGVFLIPISWYESPKDLWSIGVGSFLTTSLTISIVIFQIFRDVFLTNQTNSEGVEKPELTANAVLLSYGTIMYMNGGTAIIPTIQIDMKDKKKFFRTIGLAYIRHLPTRTEHAITALKICT
ncbi:hypothetical protein GQR58_023259 [Nymphon striatum]|nr:hypothetical protein GQR58_023259 [Nymphon striatum]